MTSTPDVCPNCGQEIPGDPAYLTPRELDVLVAWWMAGSVKKAAVRVGVVEQRAKNLLSHARIRNGVHTNKQLLAQHFDAVRSAVDRQLSQNMRRVEAA